MKVGILTWYDVLNYGSFFQAYALQETLKEMEYEVEILRHDRVLPDYYGNRLTQRDLVGILKWLRNQSPNRSRNRRHTKVKCDTFNSAREKYLSVGAHFSKTDADCVLIGSDQIFDINGMYYPFQFGGGVSCSHIGTYAPSFGETTLECLRQSEHYGEIVESIRRLSAVNARDRNTQQILAEIRGEKPEIVLDPTLLYSFKKEKETWNKRLVSEKYCLIYTWGGFTTSEVFSKQCIQFARNNGLKLVSVGEIRPWCDIQYAAASPVEFFELFMHADMVLTNMFHGTCFSIIMEKPFYSFVMSHNENKLGGLLRELGLESQIVRAPDITNRELPIIDYCELKATLDILRNNSIKDLLLEIGENG